MKHVVYQINTFFRNLFLDEVDKEYKQPLNPLRKKFREMNPTKRLEERYNEQQSDNYNGNRYWP